MRKQSVQTQLKEKGLKLNAEQMTAIKALGGVSVVNAGAGTGKTSTIVGKITYASIANPYCSILAISFTRKAVAELQGRIIGAANVLCNTFHGFFYRILRSNGYKNFGFADENQKSCIIENIVNRDKYKKFIAAADIEEALCKGEMSGIVGEAVEDYLDTLKSQRIMCFDSMQYFVCDLLKKSSAVANRVRSLYDYVLIDEAQDLSAVQADIIKLIWPKDTENNITFVGDQNQSIYSFRGSKSEVMDELKEYYSADSYMLTKNYRNGQRLLDYAEKVLPSATGMKAVKGVGKEVEVEGYADKEAEAAAVVEQIKILHNSGVPLADICVLFRSSGAVSELYEELINQNMPFVKIGSDGLKWNNGRYKAFLALLSLVHEKNNPLFKCALPIIGVPYDVLTNLENMEAMPFFEAVMSVPSLSRKQQETLAEFSRIDTGSYDLKNLCRLLWDKYIKAYLKAENDEFIDEFLEAVDKFADWAELKSYICAVRRQANKMAKLASDPTADYLRLMSVHSAKGLEYAHVFLVGAVDGILPDLSHEVVNMAEENRLAYVAVTRAKETLTVTYYKEGDAKISRFFEEK